MIPGEVPAAPAAPLQAGGGGPGRSASSPPGNRGRLGWVWRLAPRILLVLAIATVLAGQWSLELLTVDDLREAEVAREMLERGSPVVPYLAGLPFVEKPPGYPIFVAMSYRLAGGPSVPAARLTAAAFACMSLGAAYLLGRRMGGPWAGGFTAIALACSICFSRTAHTLLLDNALTAAFAWAYYFAWNSFQAQELRKKRLWAAVTLAAAGVAFLFKGFVGPAVLGASLLGAAGISGRWKDLKPFLRPLAIGAFVVPPLLWLVPFILRAPSGLQYEFFITNHLGRALHGYDSHARPFYYYLGAIWEKFAPGSVLLPFAVWTAWKERRLPWGQPGGFLLGAFVGGLTLLSLSKAKDDTYLLPLYPCLAGLIAVWATRREARLSAVAFHGTAVLSLVALLVALGAVGAGVWLGGLAAAPVAAAIGIGVTLPVLSHAFRIREARLVGAVMAVWISLTVLLAFSSPLSDRYVAQKSPRPAIELLIKAAGDRDLLLYQPEDRLRGGCGFFRNRTALEVPTPAELVDRFSRNPHSVAVLHPSLMSHEELRAEATRRGLGLVEELHVDWAGFRPVSLVRPSLSLPGLAPRRHP